MLYTEPNPHFLFKKKNYFTALISDKYLNRPSGGSTSGPSCHSPKSQTPLLLTLFLGHSEVALLFKSIPSLSEIFVAISR